MLTQAKPRIENEESFLRLIERVRDCEACSRMRGRTRVLSSGNGNLAARALFIAEAPGRLGADRSGIPLFGDQTGKNFETLLCTAGIDRGSIFVTNAVLCNPRDEAGRNSTPTVQEIRNCSPHLRETIEIIQPEYVVTLGGSALKAAGIVRDHEIVLARDVGRTIPWGDRSLIPLYHPGPRALIHRPLRLQIDDFRRLGELLHGDRLCISLGGPA